eukprot:scaffold30234_cov41-Attheya_sp.AAC.2
MYDLWGKGQVVVLMSRTPSLKDIVFIGDADETAQNLVNVLAQRSPYDDYMDEISHLFLGREARGRDNVDDRMKRNVDMGRLPVTFRSVDLPSVSGAGFVYLFMSLKYKNHVVIGSTRDIRKRLKTYNQGHGPSTTRDPRVLPVGVVGFVTGFEGRFKFMRCFKTRWQRLRGQSGGDSLTAFQVWRLGSRLIADMGHTAERLNLVQCVDFNSLGGTDYNRSSVDETENTESHDVVGSSEAEIPWYLIASPDGNRAAKKKRTEEIKLPKWQRDIREFIDVGQKQNSLKTRSDSGSVSV